MESEWGPSTFLTFNKLGNAPRLRTGARATMAAIVGVAVRHSEFSNVFGQRARDVQPEKPLLFIRCKGHTS